MPHENWLVEEEIIFDPTQAPDIRSAYIRLLEQMIEALKEPLFPKPKEGELLTELQIAAEELNESKYALPTTVFARLEMTAKDTARARLYCYRDRREFLKGLVGFGDEELIREYGLRKFSMGEKENEK